MAPPAHPARTDLCGTKLPLLLQLPLLAPGDGAGLALPQAPPDPDVSRVVVLLLLTVSSASLLAWHDSRRAALCLLSLRDLSISLKVYLGFNNQP